MVSTELLNRPSHHFQVKEISSTYSIENSVNNSVSIQNSCKVKTWLFKNFNADHCLSCAQFEQKIDRNQPNSDFDFVISIISYTAYHMMRHMICTTTFPYVIYKPDRFYRQVILRIICLCEIIKFILRKSVPYL